MSLDAFETLGLPRDPSIGLESARGAYFALAKEAGAEQQELLNEALHQLSSPDRRLKHWLQLVAADQTAGWATVAMPDQLMELFMSVAKLKSEAIELLQRRGAARTALAKALLEPKVLQLQSRASEIAEVLDGELTNLCGQLKGLVEAPLNISHALTLQAHLAYMVKWQAQVRELILELV